MTTYRVAVCGFANAGKTVLLTQLVSHLDHFKPREFCLGPGWEVSSVKRGS